jgi:hypothetical protein
MKIKRSRIEANAEAQIDSWYRRNSAVVWS